MKRTIVFGQCNIDVVVLDPFNARHALTIMIDDRSRRMMNPREKSRFSARNRVGANTLKNQRGLRTGLFCGVVEREAEMRAGRNNRATVRPFNARHC